MILSQLDCAAWTVVGLSCVCVCERGRERERSCELCYQMKREQLLALESRSEVQPTACNSIEWPASALFPLATLIGNLVALVNLSET